MFFPFIKNSCSKSSQFLIFKRRLHLSGALKQQHTMEKQHLVAVCQLSSSTDKEANFKVAKQMILDAARNGAEMVFLPECFDYMAESKEASVKMAESLDGEMMSRYRDIAKEANLWLSLGGFHEKGPENDLQRIYNCHVIVNSNGAIKAQYRKTHLFDVNIKGGVTLKETDHTIPGGEVTPPVDSPVGKIGLQICYDVRFPELSIVQRMQGADILTYPSAFTVPTGMAHWEVLLRSRAIENQCYVVAAAQWGEHNAKRKSYGHAMIVDPWGAVIAQCSDGVGYSMAPIKPTYLHRVRSGMPVINHRRHDLYGHLTLSS